MDRKKNPPLFHKRKDAGQDIEIWDLDSLVQAEKKAAQEKEAQEHQKGEHTAYIEEEKEQDKSSDEKTEVALEEEAWEEEVPFEAEQDVPDTVDPEVSFLSESEMETKMLPRWKRILPWAGLAGAVLCLTVITVIIVTLIRKNGSGEQVTGLNSSSENALEETTQEDVKDYLDDLGDLSLKKNYYPEINALVKQYFTAMEEGDLETLSGLIKSNMDNGITQEELDAQSGYIEGYDNIDCFYADVLDENAYIVYVCYEIKFLNIETQAPAMIRLYVEKGEDGTPYIFNGQADVALAQLLEETDQNEDVQKLAAAVDDTLLAYCEKDEALNALVQKIQEAVAEMGEETVNTAQTTQDTLPEENSTEVSLEEMTEENTTVETAQEE